MKCRYCKQELEMHKGRWVESKPNVFIPAVCLDNPHMMADFHEPEDVRISDRADLIAGIEAACAEWNIPLTLLGDPSEAELIQYALDLLQNIGSTLKPVALTLDSEIEETWTKPVDLNAIQYVPPTEGEGEGKG